MKILGIIVQIGIAALVFWLFGFNSYPIIPMWVGRITAALFVVFTGFLICLEIDM